MLEGVDDRVEPVPRAGPGDTGSEAVRSGAGIIGVAVASALGARAICTVSGHADLEAVNALLVHEVERSRCIDDRDTLWKRSGCGGGVGEQSSRAMK